MTWNLFFSECAKPWFCETLQWFCMIFGLPKFQECMENRQEIVPANHIRKKTHNLCTLSENRPPFKAGRLAGQAITYLLAPSGRLAGQATMYVGSPPCIWVPHHVFWSKVSGILERKWNADSKNGTRMERGFEKWNANGTRIQQNGTQIERECQKGQQLDDIKRSHQIPPNEPARCRLRTWLVWPPSSKTRPG